MRLKQKILDKFKTYWVNVFYITLFFSIFTDYRRLILAHYQIYYGAYGISFIKGLVLAKVILVAEHFHLGRGFEDMSLIVPTLYKSFMFTICVAILSIIEFMVRGFLKAEGLIKVSDVFIKCFSYEWFSGMLIVFAAFIPFFGIRELGRVLGSGKISELFFHRKIAAGSNLSKDESQ
ncbi:MAG: hypothetical protein M0R48_01175 [Candidatus Omnitrophica bacterium]|jgi:hypothetical protein|nr:hypothetical protein [Candidatus Omnitrophota bacterium]